VTPAELTALILAGGKATRLGGVAKHLLVVDGEPILARQRAALDGRCAEVIVAARVPVDGLRTVADAPGAHGPLAGIAAGLAAARTPWVLVVAGDMPHVTGAVIDLLTARSAGDAVAFRIAGLPEPLLCLLRVAAVAPVLARRLAAGRAKAAELLLDPALHVIWLEERDLRAVDASLRALTNVNAPSDLEPC
jgi:molybdenum cofactor guanylyltransferase